jgi:hypothetical protein
MRNPVPIFTVMLCGLVLRALTPVGYMPASAGSGLLFELCPDQLPVGVTLATPGHEHHAHHHESEEASSDACDLGHMLASAWIDSPTGDPSIADTEPDFSGIAIPQSATIVARRNYAPRAPPIS